MTFGQTLASKLINADMEMSVHRLFWCTFVRSIEKTYYETAEGPQFFLFILIYGKTNLPFAGFKLVANEHDYPPSLTFHIYDLGLAIAAAS